MRGEDAVRDEKLFNFFCSGIIFPKKTLKAYTTEKMPSKNYKNFFRSICKSLLYENFIMFHLSMNTLCSAPRIIELFILRKFDDENFLWILFSIAKIWKSKKIIIRSRADWNCIIIMEREEGIISRHYVIERERGNLFAIIILNTIKRLLNVREAYKIF